MYTLLNNAESSKFDLYLPGRLVASLHYTIEENENAMMFIYCESIEPEEAAQHCTELMKRALEDVHSRRMKITISCPIAMKYVNGSADNGPVPV
ncbi:hypothetical protein [Brevibacterium aurantiacum]|uniref:hypothetical protein n=1 Tax=Brevibacterium aurantiacum TaxID=273384 RepID=UPI000F6419E5|nr:hypothetical protein [Brevibacterium aurantiacum]AZL06743.1 hypothetical protein CXR24_15030 [Brevibacterium aurantiacum]